MELKQMFEWCRMKRTKAFVLRLWLYKGQRLRGRTDM